MGLFNISFLAMNELCELGHSVHAINTLFANVFRNDFYIGKERRNVLYISLIRAALVPRVY